MLTTPRERLLFVHEWVRANAREADEAERAAVLESLLAGVREIDRMTVGQEEFTPLAPLTRTEGPEWTTATRN